jgi:hypothetical protein
MRGISSQWSTTASRNIDMFRCVSEGEQTRPDAARSDNIPIQSDRGFVEFSRKHTDIVIVSY